MADTIDEYRELAMLAHAWEEGALPGGFGFIGPIVEIPNRLEGQDHGPLAGGIFGQPRPEP